MIINKSNGFFTSDNFRINHNTKQTELESTIISKGGEFKFSYECGDEKTFAIKFNDKEWVYTVRFRGFKIVLFTIEYLDFATDLNSYDKNKDRRITKTREIMSELGLDESNIYSWGKISYFYDLRNQTPLIMIKYNLRRSMEN